MRWLALALVLLASAAFGGTHQVICSSYGAGAACSGVSTPPSGGTCTWESDTWEGGCQWAP